jgi:hypothetical protein
MLLVAAVDCGGGLVLGRFPTRLVMKLLLCPLSGAESWLLGFVLALLSGSADGSEVDGRVLLPGSRSLRLRLPALFLSSSSSSMLSTVRKLVAFVVGEIGVMLLLYVLTLCVRVQLFRCDVDGPEVRPVELVLA